MDWDGMDNIVEQWRLHHSPFLKECILNFIGNLDAVAVNLQDEGDFLTSAKYFAREIQLFNVLNRDGHLDNQQLHNQRNLAYYLHAQVCILYADNLHSKGQPFLEIALQSLQKVSGNLVAQKKILKLIANLKTELLEYKYYSSGGLASIALDKIRRYYTELRALDHDNMEFVMNFFGYGDPREFLERIWSIIGPANEGASAVTQGGRNHGVQMDWIPKEHQRIAERQQAQKQQASKKKKSRRDGKEQPTMAAVFPSQLPDDGGGGGGRGGEKSTHQDQGSRIPPPNPWKISAGTPSKPSVGSPNKAGTNHQTGPAKTTPNPSPRDTTGRKDGITPNRHENARKVSSHEAASTRTSNATGSQGLHSKGQSARDPGVLKTHRDLANVQKWLRDYEFRLACKKCYRQEPRKHGYDSYSLNVNPTHFPKCTGDYLLCRLARTPTNGHKFVYCIIRCRPDGAKHSLCEDFLHGDPCKELSCLYCHSREEKEIWRAEEEGRFPRDDVIALLKTQGYPDQEKSNRKSGTPPRSRSGSLKSQDGWVTKSRSNSTARSRRESFVSQDGWVTKSRSNSNARPPRDSFSSQDGRDIKSRSNSTTSMVSLGGGDSKSRSNSDARSRCESPVVKGNGEGNSWSNNGVRSRSESLQTPNVGCSSLQHGEGKSLHNSEASKEMYETTSKAVPVNNPFAVLHDDDNPVVQRSKVKTPSQPPNTSSKNVGATFLMSSSLPFLPPRAAAGAASQSSLFWKSPGSLSTQNNNSQRSQNTQGHSVGRSDQGILNELKHIGGMFLVVCRECLEHKPMKISPAHHNNPNSCSYKDHPMTGMHNKCLVHRVGQGIFNKMRERPFKNMGIHRLQTICRHVNRLYGCDRGDLCHFAHSEAEAKLWSLEARLKKKREVILQACTDLHRPMAHRMPPAGSLRSNPQTLINPHEGAWGINNHSTSEKAKNPSATQPPSASRAIAVESCRSKVPFGHLIKRACGRCFSVNPHQIQEQNPKMPSYCNGSSRHAWGPNILYVIHSDKDRQWVRVNPRHPRLWPNAQLVLCRKGKNCKQESVFRTACLHPHTQEELQLWEYQKRHNLLKLSEVVELQQQAQASSAPLPKPEQMAAPQHTCSFCKFSCTSQTDFENHLLSTEHKAMIFSDSDRVWRERDPPNLIQDGSYEMCNENITKQCDFSGSSKEDNECIYAHSMEELQEWRQRHEHRHMQLNKARQMKLYSWLDDLVEEKIEAEEVEDVITEDIFGIEVECSRETDVVQELPATDAESTVEKDIIQWRVVLHCGREKNLKRVGLLFDEHRSYFHLSEPKNEFRPQTCPGGRIRRGDSDDYSIAVSFNPQLLPRSGLFKQWLVFDFGEAPCLAFKLSVNIGSKSEMKELEFKDQTVNTADLWNESNSKIFKCEQPDVWTQRLEEQYPTPGSDSGPPLPGDVQSLTRENYKEFMHRMLTDEERACMEMVAKYRTVTTMKVSDTVQLEDSFLAAQGEELFGTIGLDKPLHDDSEASRLVQEFVETIYIQFHEQSDAVYEAIKVRTEKGAVVVTLGPACVKERRLKGGKNVSVTVQCCINRRRFLSMHHAVESLSCMDTVLPKGQQPNRFPEVANEECREGLNSRQEQVVRHINSLGARETGEGTSYSGPTMILGPFGTGKTHTLAKAIQRTLLERKNARFLICTHSNSAADLYIKDFLHEFCEGRPDVWMVRVYATMRKMSSITKVVQHYMLIDADGPRLPTEEECQGWVSTKGPNMVVVTLSTAVELTRTATLQGYFSHIVIDEAGQALETEAIIPLALATEDTKVVLAGDPRQISPKVYQSTKAKFNMSLLQRLYKYDKQNDCQASCNLIINYRSCQPILDFLKVHYGTAFESKSTSKEHPNLYPLNFVDVRGEEELVGTSYMNAEEAQTIAEFVGSLIRNWPEEWGPPKPSEIVVLSPYRAQVEVIRGEMRKRKLHGVTVETVQNVQGKQYRAVFLSTVRARSALNKVNITSLPQVGGRNVRNKHWYGFLTDKGLLNTAFTRAQSLITVMGDPVALCSTGECQKTWQRYIKTCEKNHGIHSVHNLTMTSIQNEITNKRRLLNPAARSFVPRASASRSSPPRGSRRQSISRAVAVESCSMQTTQQNRNNAGNSPATGERVSLPASTAAAGVDDDDEDLLGDEWLQELRDQLLEEKAEEFRRSHPEVPAEHQEEEASGRQEPLGRHATNQREQEASTTHVPEAGTRSQRSQRKETSSSRVHNLASLTNEEVLQNLRMEERDGRVYPFLQDDTYDSDDEDVVTMPSSGQTQERTVEEFLRKSVQEPDKYKICIFRQDITGRMFAVPSDRQSGDVIMITSMKRRAQALNTDKVLVEVLPNIEEQEGEEDDDDAERDIKIYGRVEGIIEHNANLRLQQFVCHLDPQSNNVMVPIDRSCPKMFILGKKDKRSTKDKSAVVTLHNVFKRRANSDKAWSFKRDIEVKYHERKDKLFVVRFLEWPKKTPYPLGAATEELDPGNTFRKGLKILRLMAGIKEECKASARQEMQKKFPEDWSIPEEVIKKRIDLRQSRIFTIDPPGSTDLDDAISCVLLPGQRYRVGIHIADVSYFIHKNGAMDNEAYKRGTTFYHPFQGDVYHMMPKDVISRLLSLLPGQDRLAVSVIFILDNQGNIVAEPVFQRSVIRSCKKLTYEEAERLIVENNNTPNEFMFVAQPIRWLHLLSRQCRMQRLREGWIVYNADDDDGGAVSHPLAHSLIEELMLMTNQAVAERVLASFPDCAPLRRQLPPSEDEVEAWKELHNATARNSIRLPGLVNRNGANDQGEDQQENRDEDREVIVAAEVWKIIRAFCESQNISRSTMEELANHILQDGNHPQHAVALTDLYHIMETAEYIDSTSQSTPGKREHYSLQMRAYTHFTSPIRRYIDLVVHRMIVACIENSQCPYTPSEMADITHHCNNQNAKSKRFDKATKELKLALKLKEAPLQSTTFVEKISDASMQLLFPYRSYIPYQRRGVPFSILKPSEKPVVGDTDVQFTWKCRMYDHSTRRPAEPPTSRRVPYPDVYFRIPEAKWQQLLQAIGKMYENGNLEGVRNAFETALIHAKCNGNPFLQTEMGGNLHGRPEQRDIGFLKFQRSYKSGDTCRVQMHAQMVKGMLTPKVQLLKMTPNLDTCAEHRTQPIECFSQIATEIPGREKNITEYSSKWRQILSMTSCYSAVVNDDTVILQHMPITLQRTSSGVTGHFELDEDFLEKNHININKTKESIIRNSYDYLCIHLTNLDVDTKPRLRILEYDKRERGHRTGPFNADDWKKQTYVAHCLIVKGSALDCRTCERILDGNEETIPVHFVVHQQSVPLPHGIGDRHVASTVELIAKPEPNRREEEAVMGIIAKDATLNLVRDIALQRPNKPDVHTDAILRTLQREAKNMTDLHVPESTLHPLNHSQQAAVKKALHDTFSVIQGPPGTGKTVTGAYLAYFFTRLNQQLRAGQKRPQVLYCGPSNKSVDVVAGYLKKFGNISIVRVYSEQIERKEYPIPGIPGVISKWSRKEASMPDGMEDIALHRLIRRRGKPHAEEIAAYERRFRRNPKGITPEDIKKYKSTLFEATKLELQEHHIVLCTCNAAGAFRIKTSTRIIQVIVDEAGMCSEPETLIPLVAVKPNQIVLVGDHQQLRSIITEPNAKQLGMDISLLEKYKEKAKMLTIQYRMHERICEFPSKAFYEEKLVTDRSVKMRGCDPIRSIWPNNGATPRVFCHVNGREETLSVKSDEGSENSKSNGAEIRHVIRIVRQMINRGASPEKIMILSQYRLQCAQIEERLRDDWDDRLHQIKVSTVVKSQGSEWDYVVFSTVRSKPRIEIEERPSKGWQRKHLGFINDENQMNVALTRAKQGLIIIGNQYLLRCHNRWREMLRLYETSHCLVDACDFLARPRDQ